MPKRNYRMKYLIVVEKTETGFSAYSPDIDGCIATGNTKEEVEKNMKEDLEFHLEGLALEQLSMPEPHSYSNYLEVMA
jgi:predicted RNase H-like HicB family nuclease